MPQRWAYLLDFIKAFFLINLINFKMTKIKCVYNTDNISLTLKLISQFLLHFNIVL